MGFLWSKSDEDAPSLWERILAYPLDLWLLINESRLAIDWDELSLVLALPAGAALNLVSLVILLSVNNYKFVLSQTQNALFHTDYRSYEQLKKEVLQNSFRPGPKPFISTSESRASGADSIISFLSNFNFAIFALSLLNVYYIAVSTRYYNLMYSTHEPHTPSARRFTLIDNYSLGQMLWDTVKAKLFRVGKPQVNHPNALGALSPRKQEQNDQDVIYKDIWQLQVWQPSKFNLHFLMSLNPLLNFINILLSELSFMKLLVTNVAVTATLYYLISKFLILIQDRQILYQEMFQEYQDKFVTPRTTTLKKDVAIDATGGPYYSTILTDVVPFLTNKLRVFTTHDIEGNELKNYDELQPRNPPPPTTTTRQQYSLQFPRTSSPFRRGPSTPNYYNNSNDSYKFKLEINQLKKLNNELSRQLQHFRASHTQQLVQNEHIIQGDSDHSEEDLPWYVPSTPKNDILNDGNTVIPPPSTFNRSPSPFKMPERTPSPSKSIRMTLPTRLAPNLSQSSSRLGSPTASSAAERLNQFVRRSLVARTPELLQRSNRSSPNRSPSPLKPVWR